MKFSCWDIETKKKVFQYSEDNDNHVCPNINEYPIEAKSCLCGKDRFFISQSDTKSKLVFSICLDEIKTKKPAKFFARHVIKMFLSTKPALNQKQMEYEEVVKASVHSSRNLNSEITSKILNRLNETKLSRAEDKVEYIITLIRNDHREFARDVLSMLRLSSQINTEYNVIDYLKPGIIIPKSEFGSHRVHSTLVLGFYQFERDFIDSKIYVKINSTDEMFYINFNTVQTILVNLFINALRYCMQNTTLEIYTSSNTDYVFIKMKMRSLYLTDEIIKNGRINGTRTEQAKKKHEKGTGLGLGIISHLAELNKGSFTYNRISDVKYNDNIYDYSDNMFDLKFLKNEYY
jgi:hypothetical protein